MFQLIANSRTLAIRNHYILAIETSPTVTGFYYSIAGFHMICWRGGGSIRAPPPPFPKADHWSSPHIPSLDPSGSCECIPSTPRCW